MAQLEDMTRGFIEAALWADCMPADRFYVEPRLTGGFDVHERTGDEDTDRRVISHLDTPAEAGALAAQCEENAPEDMRETGGREHLSPDEELSAFARRVCEAFIREAGDDLDAYGEIREPSREGRSMAEMIGHDLWFSCHRHGTGLWDRETGALGDRLHDLATSPSFAYIEHCYPFDHGDGTAGLDGYVPSDTETTI